MPPLVTKLLFVFMAVAVPIVWGVVVNWLFRRLNSPNKSSRSGDTDGNGDEPVIEYYI